MSPPPRHPSDLNTLWKNSQPHPPPIRFPPHLHLGTEPIKTKQNKSPAYQRLRPHVPLVGRDDLVAALVRPRPPQQALEPPVGVGGELGFGVDLRLPASHGALHGCLFCVCAREGARVVKNVPDLYIRSR